MSPSQQKKRRQYRPPQADNDTFETQQDFLDSLRVVDSTAVSDSPERCAHCWKFYGESDPGLNNAEQPVRFRCGHVFGQLCMKELFALPGEVRVALRPLSMVEGSNGRDLAIRLDAYLAEQGIEHGSMSVSVNTEAHLIRLLRGITDPKLKERAHILGEHWLRIIKLAMRSRRNPQHIHILENGLIVDAYKSKADSKTSTSSDDFFLFHPGAMLVMPTTSASSSQSSASLGYSPASPYPTTSPDQVQGNVLVFGNWHVHDQDVKAAKSLLHTGIEDVANDAKAIDTLSILPLPSFSGLVNTPPGTSLTSTKESDLQPMTKTPPTESLGGSVAAARDIDSTISAGTTLLKDIVSQLNNPTMLPFIPYKHQAPDPDLVKAIEAAVGPSKNNPKTVAWPLTGPPSPPAASSSIMSTSMNKDNDPTMEHSTSSELCGKSLHVPGSWKEELSVESGLDKLVAIKQNLSKVKNILQDTIKGKEAHIAHLHAAEKQAQKIKAAEKARREIIMVVLARALNSVYHRLHHGEAGAASAESIPPNKRLKRLSAVNAGDTTVPPGEGMYDSKPVELVKRHNQVVQASISLHNADAGAKSYEVHAPHFLTCIEPEDSDVDTDPEGNDKKSENLVYLTRSFCSSCHESMNSGGGDDSAALPEYISWRNITNVPDGCPICQKVLFKKGPKPRISAHPDVVDAPVFGEMEHLD